MKITNFVINSAPKRIHVIPIGDKELHCGNRKCWCFPVERERGIWTHNAKDCREVKERQNVSTDKIWVNIAEF